MNNKISQKKKNATTYREKRKHYYNKTKHNIGYTQRAQLYLNIPRQFSIF